MCIGPFHSFISKTKAASFAVAVMFFTPSFGQTEGRDELHVQSPIEDVWSAEAERMQDLGDSLLQAKKPLAALAMFHGVEKRTFEPCQLALSNRGIAQVNVQTLNIAEAKAAADKAEYYLTSCSSNTRLELVLALAEVRIHMGQEEAARQLVHKELEFHPQHTELRAILARIAFIQGNWYATQEAVEAVFETIQAEGATDENLAWLQTMSTQSYIMEHLAFPDSIQVALDLALKKLPLDQQIKHHQDVLNILQSESSLALEALAWAKTTRSLIPRDHDEAYAVASLELATCAVRASAPSLAMLAYHDALKGAQNAGNNWLYAEALRQHAGFYASQNDLTQALASYQTLDSVNLAIASHYINQDNRPIKQFTQSSWMDVDAFDEAIQFTQQQGSQRPSGWPWVVSLLSLGLLSMALHNREMRKSLRTERSRIIRLRSLLPMGLMKVDEPAHTRLESELAQAPSPSEYQEIAKFLQQLDEELAYPISWEVPIEVNLAVNADIQKTLRTLLHQFKVWGEGKTPIRVQIEQHEMEWKFHVTSQHTHSSREMSTLFAGKGQGNAPWQGLYDQLQKLAARVVVERINGNSERLTITLPLGH